MRIGVPKEIKTHEYRVGLTPGAVREYVNAGHRVLVESKAGDGIGAGDDVYRNAGAAVVDTAAGSLRHGRHDRQGQGAAAGRVVAVEGRPEFCTPICIWRRIRSKRRV